MVRVSLLCCGLLLSVPFLNPYHDYPLLTFYTEWLAFAIGLVALAAMATAPSRNPIPIPGVCFGLFLLALLLAAQAAAGWVAYPLRSAVGALHLVWAALLAILGAWLRSELGEARVSHPLQWSLALAGVLAAASGFVQYYRLPLPWGVYATVQPINQMFGTVNQTNNFADYLGCALVSIAFLRARGALGSLAMLALALLLAAGMALSGSRGSWGYLGIVFALAYLLRLGGHSQQAKRVLQVASAALAFFLAVQLVNFTTEILAGPLGKLHSSADRLMDPKNMEFGGTGRGQLLLYARMMFLAHPIFGAGFGEFTWRAFEIAEDLPGAVPPGIDYHAHNLFAQLLAETGIAGLLCLAIPLGIWLWRTPWRTLSPAHCWAMGVLAVVGLHSMVEFPLWHAPFLGVFALVFGVASSGGAAVAPTRLRRGTLLLVALAGCLIAHGVWSDYRALERWYRMVEAKGARGEVLAAGDFDALMKLRADSLFGPYFERIASEAIALDERDLADKLAFNTQVMRAYPVPSVVLRQVALLALSGQDAQAARTLRGAARVYPQWTRRWLPELRALAQRRPERFSGLLESARAQVGENGRGEAFAPLPGTR